MSLDELPLDEIYIKELEVGQTGNFELDEGQSVSRHIQLRDSQGNIRASAEVSVPLYAGPGLMSYSFAITEVFP